MSNKWGVKPDQAAVLAALENVWGKSIPLVDKIESITVGVQVAGEDIIGLGLWNCGITTLPESLGQLKSLQTLRIERNHLIILPESFRHLKLLQKLNLGYNQLTTLPESFSELQSLQKLELYCNQLTTLPESFGNLQLLQILELNFNKLTTLPESFGRLQSLQSLNLGSNKIATLPKSILQLKNLQDLNLSSNQLATLPESFNDLKSLQELWINRNQLTTLPESLGGLTSLRTLHLEPNPIKNHEHETIDSIKKEDLIRKEELEGLIKLVGRELVEIDPIKGEGNGLIIIQTHCQIKRILRWEMENQREITPKDMVKDLGIKLSDAKRYLDLVNATIQYTDKEQGPLESAGEEVLKALEEPSLYGIVVLLGFNLDRAKKIGKYLLDTHCIEAFPRFLKRKETIIPMAITRKLDIVKDRFKFYIRIDNNSLTVALTDVEILLKLPPSLKLDEKASSKVVSIGRINPGGFGTANFVIECTELCKKGDQIDATLEFYDASGKLQRTFMDPYPIDRCVYTEKRDLIEKEVQELQSKSPKTINYDREHLTRDEIEDLFARNLNLTPRPLTANTILFMGQTLGQEPLLINAAISPQTVQFEIYGNEENQIGLAQQLICMQKQLQKIEDTTTKIHEFQTARRSIPLILNPTDLKKIKTKTKEKIYIQVTCICCGEGDALLIEQKDRKWVQIGKTLCHGILCGAAIISIIGALPRMAETVQHFTEAVKKMNVPELLSDLKDLGGNIEDLNAQVTLFQSQLKQVQIPRDETVILMQLDDLAKQFNDLEVEALQNLFRENPAVAQQYRESRFGLYIHKKCICEEKKVEIKETMPTSPSKPPSIIIPKDFQSPAKRDKLDKEILQELEQLIGKSIPSVVTIDWNTVGVKFKGDTIIGLGLYQCGLTTLPESFGNLKSLTYLNLNSNKLKTLPESFWYLNLLEFLFLQNNQLTTLPESFGHLINLYELEINNNKLSSLPESFGRLRSLRTLQINNNKLTTLPDSFRHLEQLRELRISSNKLNGLPESLRDLPSAIIPHYFLEIKNNPLNSYDKKILKQYKKMGMKVKG